MVEFRNHIRQINFKWYRSFLTALLLFLLVVVIQYVHNAVMSQLDTQQLAQRWSKEEEFAQISCFFTEGTGMTESEILSVEQSLMNTLADAAIDTSDENSRKLVDAYSVESTLTLTSEHATTEARAYGVSKDFFLFHPLELLSGSYFTRNDSAEDGVILDETVAWKLFGSYNVAGLKVDIGDRTYVIRGVVRSDTGLFSSAAKEDEATVYVDYAVLNYQTGQELAVDSYELLVANPVSGFGTETLTEALGRDEDSYEMVENSARFGLLSRLKRLKDFGVRSMDTRGIAYPYWENRARAYEDVSSLLLAVQLLLLLYPALFLCRMIYLFWKQKKAIFRSLREFCGPRLKKLYKDAYISSKKRKFFVK